MGVLLTDTTPVSLDMNSSSFLFLLPRVEFSLPISLSQLFPSCQNVVSCNQTSTIFTGLFTASSESFSLFITPQLSEDNVFASLLQPVPSQHLPPQLPPQDCQNDLLDQDCSPGETTATALYLFSLEFSWADMTLCSPLTNESESPERILILLETLPLNSAITQLNMQSQNLQLGDAESTSSIWKNPLLAHNDEDNIQTDDGLVSTTIELSSFKAPFVSDPNLLSTDANEPASNSVFGLLSHAMSFMNPFLDEETAGIDPALFLAMLDNDEN